MRLSPFPKSILITGASSGLGAALAQAFAGPDVVLQLGGRDSGRLDEVARRCRALGAEVHVQNGDVVDRAAMRAWIEGADERMPLDLVIANAGLGGGAFLAGEAEQDESVVRTLFDVNLTGVLNTVLPILPRFIARRGGQIALIASISAWRGLPDAPAYSAAKAAVKTYGEALRGQLAPFGVRVSVVLPGLVDTPMSAGLPGPLPFMMSAPEAALRVRKGLARDKGRIAFARPLALMFWCLAVMPAAWSDRLLASLRARSFKKVRQ